MSPGLDGIVKGSAPHADARVYIDEIAAAVTFEGGTKPLDNII
jgi:hypothetical protein